MPVKLEKLLKYYHLWHKCHMKYAIRHLNVKCRIVNALKNMRFELDSYVSNI